MQANQHLMVSLGQGVQGHQPFGVMYGCWIVAAVFEQCRKAVQYLRQLAAILLPHRLKPIVVEAAQQIVLVEACRFFQCIALTLGVATFAGVRRARECGIEFHDVNRASPIAPPLYGVVVRFQQAAFGGQRVAQVVQQLPEIGARLGLAGFRPEKRGQSFARLG